MTDESTVERMAKAIDPEAFDASDSHWKYWATRRKQALKNARAAIAVFHDAKDAEIERLKKGYREVLYRLDEIQYRHPPDTATLVKDHFDFIKRHEAALGTSNDA